MPAPVSSHRISRRAALRLASAPFVALGLGGLSRAADSGKGFTFIAVNDLHFFDEKCAPFFRNVVVKMREGAPDAAFCLIAGDIADDGETAQYAAMREIFAGLGVPLLPVPGITTSPWTATAPPTTPHFPES